MGSGETFESDYDPERVAKAAQAMVGPAIDQSKKAYSKFVGMLDGKTEISSSIDFLLSSKNVGKLTSSVSKLAMDAVRGLYKNEEFNKQI